MSQTVTNRASFVTGRKPHISLRLVAASLEAIESARSLDDTTVDFYSQLCYHYEPNRHWITLPPQLQAEIDAKLRCHEIACLQVRGLIEVQVEG